MDIIKDKIEAFSFTSYQWSTDSNALGRSPAPRAKRLRQRSLILATLNLALRKRVAEAEQLVAQIEKLIEDETAADAAQQEAA